MALPDLRMSAPRGVALVAVLWITAAISVMAMGYAATARLGAVQADNISKGLGRRYLLDSCLALGWHEYGKYKENARVFSHEGWSEELQSSGLHLWYPRWEPYRVTLDGTDFAVSLVNLAGKLNVNRARPRDLMDILGACGADDDRRQEVADAILDFIDSDGNHRLNGAENDDYYQRLSDPYLSKNAPIENIEELLLVRGVTEELYYGTDDKPGLVDFLTVVGVTNRMDINSASPRAFAIIEDFPEEAVQGIIAHRKSGPFTSMTELGDYVPVEYMGGFARYFDVLPLANLQVAAARVLADGRIGRPAQRVFILQKPEFEENAE